MIIIKILSTLPIAYFIIGFTISIIECLYQVILFSIERWKHRNYHHLMKNYLETEIIGGIIVSVILTTITFLLCLVIYTIWS